MSGTNEIFDLIVIGGGINGCGIARDATLRGLSVALVDREDIGGGTSATSTKLIHGGLRYLEYAEFPLVYESLHERKRLLTLASHLVSPLRFVIPIHRGGAYSRWTIGAGLTLYDLLTGFSSGVPKHRTLRADGVRDEVPGICADGLLGGFAYYDGRCPYPERLCLENALDAHSEGARIFTRHRVDGFLREGARVTGVRLANLDTGDTVELQSRMVVNAAGPWVDTLLSGLEGARSDRMGGTRGMHLLLKRREGGPKNAIYTPAQADGRPFFIIPWREYYWVGTTDIPHGDPDTALPTEAERNYLLREVGWLLPDAGYSEDDVLYAQTGVRPLPRHNTAKPGAITRRHIVFDHAKEEGIEGLLSIIGGKLTTYRSLAEEAVSLTYRRLGYRPPPCPTRDRPLPGSGEVARPNDVAPELWDHLTSLYGRRAAGIVVLTNRTPEWAARLDPELPDIAAQVVWACRHEHAKHIDDVMLRRTGIGTGHTEGFGCLDAVARIMAEELGWPESERDNEIARYRALIERTHRIHADSAAE
jgi:glycerol-3-phosphate dehydrogenase